MAQRFADEGVELTESPRPLLPDRQESIHPALRPSLTNIPVTPGITLGEYDSSQSTGTSSYFSTDLKKLRETMAQSPTDAAAGATTNADILRRMSLSGDHVNGASAAELDPRIANPSLGLSGGIISATFCIPHSLKFRKGSDWVN
jgi:trehalose 6-phosphate synthase/phosphatase